MGLPGRRSPQRVQVMLPLLASGRSHGWEGTRSMRITLGIQGGSRGWGRLVVGGRLLGFGPGVPRSEAVGLLAEGVLADAARFGRLEELVERRVGRDVAASARLLVDELLAAELVLGKLQRGLGLDAEAAAGFLGWQEDLPWRGGWASGGSLPACLGLSRSRRIYGFPGICKSANMAVR